jgi:hypothetical protein
MTEFEDLCAQAAVDILGGSLKLEECFSQVGEASWRHLSEINALGMLTTDSQAGLDPNERAYVCGIMPVEEAREFAERLNMAGVFVAIAMEPTNIFWPAIPMTRATAPYGEFFDDRKTSKSDQYRAQTRIPVYMDGDCHEQQIVEAGLEGDAWEYRLVQAFDARWGVPGYEPGNLFDAVIAALKDRT